MNYLTFFLIGIIGGLFLSAFLSGYFSKKEELKEGEPLATKEDIKKIAKDIEEIKQIHQDSDLLKAEKEFYEENEIKTE